MQDENTTYQHFQRCLIKKILVRGNRVPPKMGKVPFFLFLASSLHIVFKCTLIEGHRMCAV